MDKNTSVHINATGKFVIGGHWKEILELQEEK